MNFRISRRILSLLALLVLGCTVFIGSPFTFAWFTDAVQSNGNVIKSGTLDIELYAADRDAYAAEGFEWKEEHRITDGSAALFSYNLWEPGYAEMLSGLNLTIETYYAAEKNICNIIVP